MEYILISVLQKVEKLYENNIRCKDMNTHVNG